MSSQCHSYTITRHKIRRASGLSRFFRSFARQFSFGKRASIEKKPRPQLSNAEFHLTAAQMKRIIEAAGRSRDRALIRLLAETGLRRAEAANLDAADVRISERLVLIRRGKGMKSRLVPVTSEMSAMLSELIRPLGQGPVFRSRNGDRLSLRQVNRIVAESGRRADVGNPNPKYKNITPHLFRHSFARLWKSKGGSIETLANILGHQSPRTTWEVYGREGLEEMRHNYARMMKELWRAKPENKRNGL